MQPKLIGSIQSHKTAKNASKQPSREMSEKKFLQSVVYDVYAYVPQGQHDLD